MVTKAVSNTQRKFISAVVTKEPEKSYGLIHHLLKPLKQTLQNYSSDYWINIFQSLPYYTRSLTEPPSKLVIVVWTILSQIIKQHNKNVSNKKEKQTNSCNCRNKNECPLNGNCKGQNVIYNCTVSTTQTFKQRVYLGIAEGHWKQRLYNHRQSFKDKKHKNDTALSSYLWDLKENHNQIPKLTWSIVRFAPGYSKISKRCLLCLHEKLSIITIHRNY